jgi:hypothetical protein
MLEVLDKGGRRTSVLRSMTSSLDALLRSLEENETVWNKSFYDAWAVLDDVYSEVVNRGLPAVPIEYEALLEKGLSQMRRLVEARLGVPSGNGQ